MPNETKYIGGGSGGDANLREVDSAFAAATATMKPDVTHDWRICSKVMRFLEQLSPICVLVFYSVQVWIKSTEAMKRLETAMGTELYYVIAG